MCALNLFIHKHFGFFRGMCSKNVNAQTMQQQAAKKNQIYKQINGAMCKFTNDAAVWGNDLNALIFIIKSVYIIWVHCDGFVQEEMIISHRVVLHKKLLVTRYTCCFAGMA